MIIGIIGCKRSGKDTVCTIIRAHYLYTTYFKDQGFLTNEDDFILKCITNEKELPKWERIFPNKWRRQAFADKLKQCLSLVTNEPIENFYCEDLKNSPSIFTNDDNNWTRRQLLQLLGSEICRVIDPDFWVKSLFLDYKEGENLIIPDVRYKNEAKAIEDRGGILIRVIRDNPTFEHSSETGLTDYRVNAIIYNTSDLQTLIYNTLRCLDLLKI